MDATLDDVKIVLQPCGWVLKGIGVDQEHHMVVTADWATHDCPEFSLLIG